MLSIVDKLDFELEKINKLDFVKLKFGLNKNG